MSSQSRGPCFTKKQLQKYLDGDISAEDGRLMESHVEHCEHCLELVESLLTRPGTPELLGDSALKKFVSQSVERGSKLRQEDCITFGQYQVYSFLGRGGMGDVYRARSIGLGRWCAIKVITPNRILDHKSGKQFKNEMKAIGSLKPHTNVVTAYDAGELNGCYYLAMELVDGGNLEEFTHQFPEGRLPIDLACEVILQAAKGLQHAHQHELLHCDLKPSNLLLSSDGTVKIADLGTARPIPFHENGSPHDPERRQIVGTVDYMAPELMNGGSLSQQSDLYSLGCTFYRLITGTVPFPRTNYESRLQQLEALQSHAHVPVSQIRPNTPSVIARIIDQLLEKQPSDRISSASEVAELIDDYEGETLLASHTEKLSNQFHETPVSELSIDQLEQLLPPPRSAFLGSWGKLSAFVACVITIALVLGWWLSKPNNVFNEPGTFSLLEAAPIAILAEDNDKQVLDREHNELLISAEDHLSLVQLGETQAQRYEVSIDLGWQGNSLGSQTGFFWGYNKGTSADGEPCFAMQALIIQPDPNSTDLLIERHVIDFFPFKTKKIQTNSLTSTIIKAPPNGRRELVVGINEFGLEYVYWCGASKKNLIGPLLDDQTFKVGHRGRFGVLVQNNFVTITGAEISIKNGPEPPRE